MNHLKSESPYERIAPEEEDLPFLEKNKLIWERMTLQERKKEEALTYPMAKLLTLLVDLQEWGLQESIFSKIKELFQNNQEALNGQPEFIRNAITEILTEAKRGNEMTKEIAGKIDDLVVMLVP